MTSPLLPGSSPTDPFRRGSQRTRLLVSVRDAAEAQAASAAGADLVDAKDPDRGALGALDEALVTAIHEAVRNHSLTSAVAGDDADAESLAAKALAFSKTGVSAVKLGLHPSLLGSQQLDHLGFELAGKGTFIAVLFAEELPRSDPVGRLAKAGFSGVMIDTGVKDGRRLTDHLPLAMLNAFVASCHGNGMICGLAGSLQISDIPVLAPLGPHFLGFRGGLCHGGQRKAGLDGDAIRRAAGMLARARSCEMAS